jgi:ABC-type multidrug transport system ATPase subunit
MYKFIHIGKTLLLKALSGRISKDEGMFSAFSKMNFDGSVTYNGESKESGKFLIPKFVDYVEQNDSHAATLTVAETLTFAWKSASGGHHSYGLAKDKDSADFINSEDERLSRVNNTINILGLHGCRDTVVGDNMLRGISGGQKRRVTMGEMFALPRPIKFMDCISNGLDAVTTFDIIQAAKNIVHHLDSTFVISLLQPPPEVFDLFDEVILMSEGQIIYQGPTQSAVEYFESIGYICPKSVDPADFLQELPTMEGRRFVNRKFTGASMIDEIPLSCTTAVSEDDLVSTAHGAQQVDKGTHTLIEIEMYKRLYMHMYECIYLYLYIYIYMYHLRNRQ